MKLGEGMGCGGYNLIRMVEAGIRGWVFNDGGPFLGYVVEEVADVPLVLLVGVAV